MDSIKDEEQPSGLQTRPNAEPVGNAVQSDPAMPPRANTWGAKSQDHGEPAATTRSAAVGAHDFRPPRRTGTAPLQRESSDHGSGLRKRSTAQSRRSVGEAQHSTVAERTRGLSLAGPEQTTQLQAVYEPYVHPEYATVNPSYEQPANAKPVWSLAKPLPRVLRPGMVPMKIEILEPAQNAQLPAENSQQVGVEVDPNDLEAGRIDFKLNPSKVSAQLKDSRTQRKDNFQAVSARRGTVTSRLATRPTRASSTASQAGRERASSAASQRSLETDILAPRDDVKGPEASPKSPVDERLPSREADQQISTQLQAIPENGQPKRLEDSSPDQSDDDKASQDTIRVDDEPEMWQDMESIKIVHNAPLLPEVHNNHNWWSVVRTKYREFLAEFLATFVQLTIGFCGDTQTTLNTVGNPNTTAWTWGFATMIGIYISGGISGAHLNPAITMMLWFYRGFPKRKMPAYLIAQFLAAFFAAFAAYGVYLVGIQSYLDDANSKSTDRAQDILNGFVTSQRYTFIDAATAFFNEFLGTAFLACTILALGDDQNAPPGAGMNSLIIGLVITGLNLSFVYNTGLAMNPSRDLAPRLAMLILGYGSELFTNPYWFYGPCVAPICGAFVGAGLYDLAIFTGGESPINYPWTRTKRSYKKGEAKWKRRFRLKGKAKNEVE